MRRFIAILAVLGAGIGPALAYDAASQAIIDRFKPGKRLPLAELASLMLGAERWCYNQQDGECAWSDIYLWADESGAGYELSNPWSETVDISLVDRGVFRDDRYFCEAGFDWIASVRAYSREDGLAIEGRDLHRLREDIAAMMQIEGADDCFDYLYGDHDAEAQTITLQQRQFVDGVHQATEDAQVTLHFDKHTADNLGWYQ